MFYLEKPYREEVKAFGKKWIGVEKYEHWKEVLIAKYQEEPPTDGQPVNVYCTAAPARFYRLKVKKSQNSVGKWKKGYEIVTGSGQWELAAKLAKAISEGMLGFNPK